MDFVTVARFSSSFNANVIKFRLEHEGIPCFLRDEHSITVKPFWDIALGGIRLQVLEKDVEAAHEILKDAAYIDSGSISGFNPYEKFKKETSTLKKILIVIFTVLLLLSM